MSIVGYVLDVPRFLGRFGPVRGSQILVGLLRRGGTVTFRDGGQTYVMPNGRSTRYHLLESTAKLRRLAEHVRPDDSVVVDVGAHAGLFSAFALERAPGASALLIEPEAAMRSVIERNLVGRDHQLVTAAVADVAGEATFYRAESSQESSLVQATIRSRSEPVTVPTVTLDELCADLPAIDVLKIDVQGAEDRVLGGGQTLPKVRTLLIEISMADPAPHLVLAELVATFGPWRFVNPVYAGADLVFERN